MGLFHVQIPNLCYVLLKSKLNLEFWNIFNPTNTQNVGVPAVRFKSKKNSKFSNFDKSNEDLWQLHSSLFAIAKLIVRRTFSILLAELYEKAILTLVVMPRRVPHYCNFSSFFCWKSFPNTHANDIDNKYSLYGSDFAWEALSMEHDTAHKKNFPKVKLIKKGYKFIFILTMC